MKFAQQIFCLLALLMAHLASGQKPHTDSLKQILANTNDPNRKVDLLCRMAYDLFDFDDVAAEGYATQAKKLAEKNNYQSGLKYSLTIIGLGNLSAGEYQQALGNFYASKKINAPLQKELIGYNLMLIGSVYRDLAYYDSAEHYYKQAIQLVGESGDPYYLGFFYRGLAHVKIILWQNQEAIDYLKKAESYALIKPDDYYVIMIIWDLYGRAYTQLLDYDKADYYFNKMCEQEKHTNEYLQRIKCFVNESNKAVR